MVGIYFSGTGNSKYAAELFCKEYDNESSAYSIEEKETLAAVTEADFIVFAYPVQFSTVPKILRDYITDHKELWVGKKVFIISTMGLFSGDGSGSLGRLLQSCGANVIGGLHLKMPDSIADEKALKRPLEKNKELIKQAGQKIKICGKTFQIRDVFLFYIFWLSDSMVQKVFLFIERVKIS